MKLLDILARELKAWPDSWGDYCVSSRVFGVCAAWFNHREPQPFPGGWKDIGSVEVWLSGDPEDRKEAVVTRTQWQAAVDALKADRVESSPAMYAQRVGRVTRLAAWNGEGFPPAGVEVEVELYPDGGWIAGHVSYYGRAHYVFESKQLAIGGEIVGKIGFANFRPVRTSEQIAAEKRTKACDEMYGVILGLPEDRRKNVSDICEALYDAGYQKP